MSRPTVLIAAAVMIAAGCSKSNHSEQTSGGAVDTAVLKTGSVSPAVGPAVQVTRTDSKSIDRAMRYELTPDNFAKFIAAADSVAALERRDPTARAYLGNNLTDAGSTEPDAGLKWLQADTVVTRQIESAGLSAKDYFIESIAIASARRFIGDPKAAPPTPTLEQNAKFLADRKAALDHLQRLREGKLDVISTP